MLFPSKITRCYQLPEERIKTFAMDYFTIFLNLFTLTVLGMMHLIFISRITGKTLKYRYFAAYLFLLNFMELFLDRKSVV